MVHARRVELAKDVGYTRDVVMKKTLRSCRLAKTRGAGDSKNIRNRYIEPK